MNIQTKALTASAAITSAACYVLSVRSGLSNEEVTAYHGAAATAGNQILSDQSDGGDFAPLPGIYCSDGCYLKVDKGTGIIRYYIAE